MTALKLFQIQLKAIDLIFVAMIFLQVLFRGGVQMNMLGWCVTIITLFFPSESNMCNYTFNRLTQVHFITNLTLKLKMFYKLMD